MIWHGNLGVTSKTGDFPNEAWRNAVDSRDFQVIKTKFVRWRGKRTKVKREFRVMKKRKSGGRRPDRHSGRRISCVSRITSHGSSFRIVWYALLLNGQSVHSVKRSARLTGRRGFVWRRVTGKAANGQTQLPPTQNLPPREKYN
jgi:hypothetical protein